MTARDPRALILELAMIAAYGLRRARPNSTSRDTLRQILHVASTGLATVPADGAAPEHETQVSIAAWVVETFGGLATHRDGLRLLEEALELCDALGVEWQDVIAAVNRLSRRFARPIGTPSPHDVAGEIADVMIVARGIAGCRGIDPDAAVDAKMRVNRKRDWAVKDGVGYHVEEPAA